MEKMKNFLAFFVVGCMITGLCAQATATDEVGFQEENAYSVLSTAKLADGTIPEDVLQNATECGLSELLDSDSVNLLSDIDIGDDTDVYVEKYSSSEGDYKKVQWDDGHYICLNNNNEIVEISNFDDTKLSAENATISTQQESAFTNSAIDTIVHLLNLTDEYIVKSMYDFDQDYICITLSKNYNGIVNLYESVNTTLSKSDGRIVSLNRFDMMPDEATPQIS